MHGCTGAVDVDYTLQAPFFRKPPNRQRVEPVDFRKSFRGVAVAFSGQIPNPRKQKLAMTVRADTRVGVTGTGRHKHSSIHTESVMKKEASPRKGE